MYKPLFLLPFFMGALFVACDRQPNEPTIYGCTDADAYNYNPSANHDDGSCEYLSFEYSSLDLYEGGCFPLGRTVKAKEGYKIINTGDITITYWAIELEIFTDRPGRYAGYLYDNGNLWLERENSYEPEGLRLSVLTQPSYERGRPLYFEDCDENITRWEVTNLYATGP